LEGWRVDVFDTQVTLRTFPFLLSLLVFLAHRSRYLRLNQTFTLKSLTTALRTLFEVLSRLLYGESGVEILEFTRQLILI
jgi:hypothetical protein